MGRGRSTARRRVSQADVARLAGVSTGIVSSVINSRDYGSIRVSETTRERVRAAVRELGYVPNIAARNLARGSNRLIGIFTYEPLFPLESRNFYHEFLIGIEEAAEAAEHNLLLVSGAKTLDNRRSIYAGGVNQLQLADGALLVGTHENDEEIVRLAHESYPFVFIGQREFEGVDLSYVAADYVQGTASVVEEVLRLGHERVALIFKAGREEPIPGRRAGFARAVSRLKLNPESTPLLALGGVDGPRSAPDAPSMINKLLEYGITSALVESSETAVEIRTAAERSGLAVPDDMSIVGLGGSDAAPDLTEMHIPRHEMGQEAVRLLLTLLADPESAPVRTTLPCSLRRRGTLSEPKSARPDDHESARRS